MKILLLVSSHPFGLSALRALARAGHEVHVWGAQVCPDAALSRHCASYRRVEPATLTRPLALARALTRARARLGFAAVVPADMATTWALSEAREQLAWEVGYPLAPADLLRRLDNKASFSALLEELRLPQPWFRLLRCGEPAPALAFPLLAKDPWGEGSKGVYPVASPAGLDALRRPGRPLLLQELVEGEDEDVVVLAQGGRIAAALRQRGRANGGVKQVLADLADAAPLVERLVSALRLEGVLQFDLRRRASDGRLLFIECNPRLWGTLDYAVLAGRNFPAMALSLAAGEELRLPPLRPGRYRDPGLGLASLASLWSEGSGTPQARCQAANLADPLAAFARRLRLEAVGARESRLPDLCLSALRSVLT